MPDELSQEQTGRAGVWSLRSHLEVALATCWRGAIAHHRLLDPPDLQGQIALRRVNAPTGVVYSSAIAPRLAAKLGIPITDLVEVLAQSWPPSSEDNTDWADSPLRVTSKHLVQIHLGDRLLATWLQQFARPTNSKLPGLPNRFPGQAIGLAAPRTVSPISAQPSPDRFQDDYQDKYFEMQAAHARCCSLLALAERVELVRFEVQGATDSALVSPAPLPWLKAEGTLRTQQPIEQQLINQLLDNGDALGQTQKIQHRSSIALGQALSRCVYDFDASCRIFGDVAVNQLELAQARLGLVRAAQQTLRWLLEVLLQIEAPVSL